MKTLTMTGRQHGKTTAALEYIATLIPGMTVMELKIMAQANYGGRSAYNKGIVSQVEAELSKRSLKLIVEKGSCQIVPS